METIEYGIFMDSGPLHLAKLLRKRGTLIITTVGQDILLNSSNLAFLRALSFFFQIIY